MFVLPKVIDLEEDPIEEIKVRFKSDLITYNSDDFTFSQVEFTEEGSEVEISITLEDEKGADEDYKIVLNLMCTRIKNDFGSQVESELMNNFSFDQMKN